MALTINAACDKAAVDAIAALFNSGKFVLNSSAPAELAAPTFGATAFGAGTSASPSVATAEALTKDSSVTAGTVAGFDMQTSGAASRISGTVGTDSGDFRVSSVTIPAGAVSVNITGLTLSLEL